jgi:hypothetical protein
MNMNVEHDKMNVDRASASSSSGSKSDRTFGRNCTFCVKKGIIGPHDHFVKTFSHTKGLVITCPELLKIQCAYCKNPGHTKNYCENLKNKKVNKSRIGAIKQDFKRMYSGMINDIEEKRQKIRTVDGLSSAFGAVDMSD